MKRSFSIFRSCDLKIIQREMSKKPKEPIHRIFYICSTFIPDEEWSQFLKECSFGKFPRGIKFENNTIKCTQKKKEFTQIIPKDVNKALDVILKCFRDKVGIKTEREKKSHSMDFEKKRKKALVIKDWKSLSQKVTLKQSLIRIFAENFVRQNFLTSSEHSELIILIELGTSLKIIDADDVIMENGLITEIKNLSFDYHTRKLKLRGASIPIPMEIDSYPIYFNPVTQHDYEQQYGNILKYYQSKLS